MRDDVLQNVRKPAALRRKLAMRKTLACVFAWLAGLMSITWAQQQIPTMPPNTVFGRLGGGGIPGPGSAIPITSLSSLLPSVSIPVGLPVVGNGSNPLTSGTKSGNTTTFGTTTGTLASGHCVSIDANGNLIDAGGICSVGGGIPNQPAFTTLCNPTASTAAVQGCTQTQETALINAFTTSLSGAAPASGGGTTNFLRADGTWTTPVTPGQVPGTTTNDNATAGNVGEYVQAANSSVSLTSGGANSIAQISLTAGDWDVSGAVGTVCSNGGTLLQVAGAISTVNNSLNVVESNAFAEVETNFGCAGTHSLNVPTVRLSLTTATNVFVVEATSFTGAASGFGRIRARRVR
jgi:hypothetical protein